MTLCGKTFHRTFAASLHYLVKYKSSKITTLRLRTLSMIGVEGESNNAKPEKNPGASTISTSEHSVKILPRSDHRISMYMYSPTAPPSGSAKCLRFGHWLTLCTLNMHLLTYLLTWSCVLFLRRCTVRLVLGSDEF